MVHHARPVHAAGIDQLDRLAKRPARVHHHRATEPTRQRQLLGKRRLLPAKDPRSLRLVLR
ncbi:MAG: hypothetical protein BWX86_02847 [Verrucomicrobia bacterium ADurb.Bin122]|nr:MAG: hypothetical protein BWX86_02847 [Verrucomicrobia bacterium ADurb.Bin122]